MEQRCKTCQHYAAPEAWRVRNWGETAKGTCDLTNSTNSRAEAPASLAVAQDAESYAAWLEVAPEFGCVQWQPLAAAPATGETRE